VSDQFVFITDTHIANKPPASRIDNYNESILKKIRYVIEYAKKNKIKKMLHGGDLFHTAKVSDEICLQVVDLFANSGMDIYYIFGNHDIEGGNTTYVDKTNLGFFTRYRWFHLLHNKVYEFNNCVVSGVDYSKDMECSFNYDFPHYTGKKKKILLAHPMIVGQTTIEINGKVRQVNVKEVETEADLLLVGHNHLGFKPCKGEILCKPYKIMNPGSMARISHHEATKTIGPNFIHIKVLPDKLITKVIKIPRKKAEKVFDVELGKAKRDKKYKRENFIKELNKISGRDVMVEDVKKELESMLVKPPKKLKKVVSKKVIKLCLEKIR
jgi:DNA repair exonuclease SbcCD nuclease subunit